MPVAGDSVYYILVLTCVCSKKDGEEYQPHHDFVYPSIKHRYQPTRFATLLLYLNTVPEGGETRFPKAVNSQFAEGVEFKPVVGRAVLFYNMLPDGHVDDLSQHGSNPTNNHEKWLANLWVGTQVCRTTTVSYRYSQLVRSSFILGMGSCH
jgi:hypothetical protein